MKWGDLTVDQIMEITAKDVKAARELIWLARTRVAPPSNPPSMLWSALCNMYDHLDTLHRAITSGDYDDSKGPFEPKASVEGRPLHERPGQPRIESKNGN